jgi:drug/metabolite transporter (DMT)-like permease
MNKISLESKSWQWLALILLSLIWGSSFILMKRGLESYSNTQVAAFRIFFSFIFLLPLTLRNLKIIRRDNLRSLIIVGLVGFAIPAFLFSKAQTSIDSLLAGILNSLTPLFTLIVGVLLYRSSAKWMNITGLFIGLIGALGLMWNGDMQILKGINSYALFVVAATICYGVNVNEVKFKLSRLTSLQITSMAFVFTGPIAGIYLLFTDLQTSFQTTNAIMNLCYIGILALFSSVIAVLIFNHLIKFTTPLFASSVTYLIPFVAIIWGIIDGEAFGLLQILWICIILLGVYLVNK